jgi:hypothetical protein
MTDFESRLREAASTDEIVDLQDLFLRFTLESFVGIGFNETLGCLKSREIVPFAKGT